MDRYGTIGVGRQDLLRSKTSTPQIFVPGDFIIISGGRKDIHIAIAIQVSGMYRERAVHNGGNDLLRAEVATAKVFVPGDFVVVEGG